MTHRWRKVDSNLYGAFPVKWLFSIYCRVFVRSGKGRSSSRRLRSGSRSARKGSRDRNASGAWRLAALARLVFRSALTPEHAEGRWGGDGPFFEALRLMAPAIRLRDDRRGARHWVRIAHRKLHMRAIGVKRALHCLIETCSRCLIWSPRQPSLVLFSTRY